MSFLKINSARSSFIFILILSQVLFALPEFILFISHEYSQGQLYVSEAFYALCVSCFGGLGFTVFFWLLFAEPIRKSALKKKIAKTDSIKEDEGN